MDSHQNSQLNSEEIYRRKWEIERQRNEELFNENARLKERVYQLEKLLSQNIPNRIQPMRLEGHEEESSLAPQADTTFDCLSEEELLIPGNPVVLCKLRNVDDRSKHLDFERNLVHLESNRKSENFEFDKVLGFGSSRQTLFESIEPLVKNVANGKQTMIMSIGTTNAGKSYNLFGDLNGRQKSMGIIQMSIESLLEQGLDIFLSFSEVYDETIIDLLTPSKRHAPKTSQIVVPVRGTYLRKGRGVCEMKISNIDHAMTLIRRCVSKRSTQKTDQNAVSSRSSAFVTLRLHRNEDEKPFSSLMFVDLAGYEKIHGSNSSSARKREGTKINLSLLALKNLLINMKRSPYLAKFRDTKVNNLIQSFLKADDAQQIYTICATNAADQVTMTKDVLDLGSNIIRNIENGSMESEKMNKSPVKRFSKRNNSKNIEAPFKPKKTVSFNLAPIEYLIPGLRDDADEFGPTGIRESNEEL